VVTGQHAKAGATGMFLLVLMVAPLFAFVELQQLASAGVVAIFLGVGAGYRVVLQRERVTVWKTCFGIPWWRKTYGRDAAPSIYWAFEDRKPSGVVMCEPGRSLGDFWWIFGTEDGASALEQLIETELTWVRATKPPP